MKFPEKLDKKLQERKENNSFRTLYTTHNLIDFSSNDYLGFAKNTNIANKIEKELATLPTQNGSTGSRLLSGNFDFHANLEEELATFFEGASATLYNSGYDANVGLLSCIGQKDDVVLYDELCHASIRDGIRLSHAKSYSFKHNDLTSLQKKYAQVRKNSFGHIYLVVESVYSMDGDVAPLLELSSFCKVNNIYLIVDEAHAIGLFGRAGRGLVAELSLQKEVFARIYTFGKALGSHGAVIVGSNQLKQYLINFSRSFIYTTAMPLHQVLGIQFAVQELQTTNEIEKLKKHIHFFKHQIAICNLTSYFIESNSAIQSCVLGNNQMVKSTAQSIRNKSFDVKPILSPTVALGKERLRFCIHSFNTRAQIEEILELLTTFVDNFKENNG